MNLRDFQLQIKAPSASSKAQLMNVSRTIAEGDQVLEAYASHLEAAEDYKDFLEAIYSDQDLLMDDAWGYACRILHPEAALDRFTPLAVAKGQKVSAGALTINGKAGSFTIRAPHDAEESDIYVFADGSLNELALAPAGKFAAECVVAGVPICGVCNVFHFGTDVVIMPWEVDESGQRPHARATSATRARNSVKPKSGNC